MNEERKFLEGLFKDRCNFFLLFGPAIVLTAIQATKDDPTWRTLIFTCGELVLIAFYGAIVRTHLLVHRALNNVYNNKAQPYRILCGSSSKVWRANNFLLVGCTFILGLASTLLVTSFSSMKKTESNQPDDTTTSEQMGRVGTLSENFPASMNMPLVPAALLLLSAIALLQRPCFGELKAEPEANLFLKPTFEKASWEVKIFGNPGTVGTDLTEMHDGHPSLRVHQANPAGVAFLNQTIPVKPATRYRFSGWISAATKMVLSKDQAVRPPEPRWRFFPDLGNSGWVSDTGDWVHASVDFTTKGKQTEVQLGPRVGFNQWRPTGTAWFADLSLIELGPAWAGPKWLSQPSCGTIWLRRPCPRPGFCAMLARAHDVLL